MKLNNICYSRKLFVSKNSWIVVPFCSPIWFRRKIFSLWQFPKKMLQFQVRFDIIRFCIKSDRKRWALEKSREFTQLHIRLKPFQSLLFASKLLGNIFYVFINRKSLFPIFIKIIEKNKRNESIGMYDSLVQVRDSPTYY